LSMIAGKPAPFRVGISRSLSGRFTGEQTGLLKFS
jgi:hypothetical protein